MSSCESCSSKRRKTQFAIINLITNLVVMRILFVCVCVCFNWLIEQLFPFERSSKNKQTNKRNFLQVFAIQFCMLREICLPRTVRNNSPERRARWHLKSAPFNLATCKASLSAAIAATTTTTTTIPMSRD